MYVYVYVHVYVWLFVQCNTTTYLIKKLQIFLTFFQKQKKKRDEKERIRMLGDALCFVRSRDKSAVEKEAHYQFKKLSGDTNLSESRNDWFCTLHSSTGGHPVVFDTLFDRLHDWYLFFLYFGETIIHTGVELCLRLVWEVGLKLVWGYTPTRTIYGM